MANAKDPVKVAERWASALGSSNQAVTDGVNNVTQAPGAAAAAQRGKWLANVNASVDRWAQATAAVPLQSWKDAMLQKGLSRITSGAAAAKGKFAGFMQQWLQYEANAVASLPPRGDLETNISRSAEMARKNAQARGQFRQGGRSR